MRPRNHVSLLSSPLKLTSARNSIPTSSRSVAWQCLQCRYASLPAQGKRISSKQRTPLLRYAPARRISTGPIPIPIDDPTSADGKPAPPGSTITPTEQKHLDILEAFHKQRLELPEGSYPEKIAIVGGGISGLATAHFVAKEFPKSKITIFEGSERVGGWVKSVKVPVEGDKEEGHVLFEYGPRTLRPGPGALATVQLIQDLGLEEDTLTISSDAPAAQNRYIYYPDRLNKLPSGSGGLIKALWEVLPLLQTGVLDGSWNVLREGFQQPRPKSMHDESVGHWIERRVDKRVADNVVSAVLHGIYAGDAYQLSMRSIMPMLWHMEDKYDGATQGMLEMMRPTPTGESMSFQQAFDAMMLEQMHRESDVDPELSRRLSSKKISTFTFKEGMQQLVRRLEENLRGNPNIEILTETPVQEYRKVKESQTTKIELLTATQAQSSDSTSSNNHEFDFVICAAAPPTTETGPTSTDLAPPVTVQTVNLFYKNPSLAPVHGFGYLIPQSVPVAQNPERALGVIFDHDATPAFDASAPEKSQDSIPGTKLTVMMGGHWWDGWTEYPSSEEAKEKAMAVVKRHLGIDAEPDLCHVNLSQNCIPQYTVGYEERLRTLSARLVEQFSGRVRVVGAPYNGVGLNDCIRAGWEMAYQMRCGSDPTFDAENSEAEKGTDFGGRWRDNGTAGLKKVEKGDWWVHRPRGYITGRAEARKKDRKAETARQLKEMREAYKMARERAIQQEMKVERQLKRRR